jgi:hypothetical protein
MSEKKPQIDPNHQGSLLTLVGEDRAAVPAESFPHDGPADKVLGRPATYDVVYGPEGSYKDLTERAEELVAALDAFGLRNQRVGFAVASNSPRHRGPIFGRYTTGIAHVQGGAERNASQKFLNTARESFWRATGFAAIRNSGLMNENELNARARKMWEQFSGRYGTTIAQEDTENTARPEFKKTLEAQIKMTEEIKLRKAA